MSVSVRCIFAPLLALALLSGCAVTERAAEPPPPVRGEVEATLKLDVPSEFAERATIPAVAEGKISLSFESKAIRAAPLRSHFEGKIALVITDPEKTRRYVDFTATLSGDYNGAPDEGWSRASAQASDLVRLFYQGLQKPEAAPKTP